MAYGRGRAFRALGAGLLGLGGDIASERQRNAALERQALLDEENRAQTELGNALSLASYGGGLGTAPTQTRTIPAPVEPVRLDTQLFPEPSTELAGARDFMPVPDFGPAPDITIDEPDPRYRQITPGAYIEAPGVAEDRERAAGIDRLTTGMAPFLGPDRDPREVATALSVGTPEGLIFPEPPEDELADELERIGALEQRGLRPSGVRPITDDEPPLSTEASRDRALQIISDNRTPEGEINWDIALATNVSPPVRDEILRYRTRMGEIDMGLAGPTFEPSAGGLAGLFPAGSEEAAVMGALPGGSATGRPRRGPSGGYEVGTLPPTTTRPSWQERTDELRAQGMNKDEVRRTLLSEGYNLGPGG